MKKLVALVLALFMLLGVASCGASGSESSQAPASTGASSSAQSASAAGEPAPAGKAPEDYVGTIRLWSVWDEENGAAPWLEQFNAIYPNIKVEISKFSNTGDGNIQLDTALMAGEVDVCFSFGARMVARSNAGMFYDLTDLLAEAGLDSMENWGLEDNFDGKITAIPFGGNNDHIIINKTIWDAAGLGEIPTSWTIDEYYEAARKMHQVGSDGNVEVYGCSNYHSIYYWSILARGYLGDDYYYNADGTSAIDNQAYRDAFQLNYDADIVEKIQFPLITYRDDGIVANTPFYEGRVGMSQMTNALTRQIANTADYDFDFDITYAPIPTLYKDQDVNYCDGLYYFTHMSIAESCADPELAWQFVKWFSTEGSIYFSGVGHLPTWKYADRAAIVDVTFGSEAAAAELIDVEAYKRVVLNYDGSTYVEHNQTALSEIGTILNTVTMEVYRGQKTIEQGFEDMKAEMDAAILAAS